jgi:exopolysaccharide biosynthesis protein
VLCLANRPRAVNDLPVRSHHRAAGFGLVAFSLVATAVLLPSPARGAAPDPVRAGPARALLSLAAHPLDYGPIPLPLLPHDPAAPAQPIPSRPAHNGVVPQLPLGARNLKETRSVRTIARGVTLTIIKRGGAVSKGKRGAAWVVRVLTIDPAVADGHLATTFGKSLAGTAPTTTLTRQIHALAGVNASFFSIGSKLPGIPVGLTVNAGRVLSDSSGMKREVTLLVDTEHNELRIGRLRWSGRLREVDGARSLRLQKVNAIPHVPHACRSAREQRHCRADGQIAVFTPRFGKHTPKGVGTEVVLDRNGCAVKVQSHRGVRLGHGRSSIQATGATARALRALARNGCIDVTSTLRDTHGEPIDLRSSTAAVSGRFQLLDEGRDIAPTRHGGFFARHPRTLAGTTWDNKIVFATIDGGSRHSIGATLKQAARVARALGMRDAINLDGGGSTTMSIHGKLANKVSGSRERAVSDALVWVRKD